MSKIVLSGEYPRIKNELGLLSKCLIEEQSYLYLIYFPNGRLKIGKTINPQNRISTHYKAYNSYVTNNLFLKIFIIGPFVLGLTAEKELISIFKSKGYFPDEDEEWFIAAEETSAFAELLTSKLVDKRNLPKLTEGEEENLKQLLEQWFNYLNDKSFVKDKIGLTIKDWLEIKGYWRDKEKSVSAVISRRLNN